MTKRNFNALIIMALVIILYVISSIYTEGACFALPTSQKLDFINGGENYGVELKDLRLSNGAFISDSYDPYILVTFNSPVKINNIDLNLRVSDDDNLTLFEVSGLKEGINDFSNVASAYVSNGNYSFPFIADEYTVLRLDITSEINTMVNIDSLYCGYSNRSLGLFLCLVFCAAAIYFLWLNRGRVIAIGANNRFKICLDDKTIGFLFLTISVFATLFAVYFKMYADGNLFIFDNAGGADTFNSYLPLYNYAVDRIREGNFDLWSSEFGFGKMNVSLEPILKLCILPAVFAGNQIIPYMIVVYRCLAALLSSWFCYKYLSLFSDKYGLVSIASYIYAFNGYSTVMGQHYGFSFYSVYAIIIFFCIEKYLRSHGKKFSLSLISASFLVMYTSAYMSYMLFLTAAVYSVIRFIMLNEVFSFKLFVIKFANMAANIIIGFGLSVVRSIQEIKDIMGSGRVLSDASVSLGDQCLMALKTWFLDQWWYFPQKMVSGALSGVGDNFDSNMIRGNYHETIQLFFGILFIVLIIQFIFNIHKNKSKKIRICLYLSVLLITFSLVNRLPSFVYNFFSSFDAIYLRYTFTFMPIFALAVLTSLSDIIYKKIFSIAGMVLGIIFTMFIIFTSYIYIQETSITGSVAAIIGVDCVLLALGAYSLVIANHNNRPQIKSSCIVCIAFICIINCFMDYDAAINRPRIISQASYEGAAELSDKTQGVIEEINRIDNTYFRLDKTYADHTILRDSYYQNYKGLSGYEATYPNDIKAYINGYMDPKFIIAPALYSYMISPNELIQYSALGLKYVLSRYKLPNTDCWEQVLYKDGIYAYRNKYVNSFTTFYTQAVPFSEFSKLSYADKTKILQNSIVINDDDVHSLENYSSDAAEAIESLGESDITQYAVDKTSLDAINLGTSYAAPIEIQLTENWGEKYDNLTFIEMSLNAGADYSLGIYIDVGEGYVYRNDFVVYIRGGHAVMRCALPKNTQRILINFSAETSTLLNSFKITETEAELKPQENPSVIIDNGVDSLINAEISCDKDGILLVPLPYDSSWNISVDGVKTEFFHGNTGFMAIEVLKGDHTISIDYEYGDIKYGIIISFVSLLLAVIYWLTDSGKISGIRHRKEKTID